LIENRIGWLDIPLLVF